LDGILRSGHESIVHDILKEDTKKETTKMNNRTKYSEEFKKQVVALHQNGKPYRQLAIEYGVNINTIAEWVRKYSEVKMPDDTVMTARKLSGLENATRNLRRKI